MWPFQRRGSGEVARERLRAALVQDRTAVSPQLLGALREAIVRAVADYVDCDPHAAEVAWARRGEGVQLVASIPLRGVRRMGALG